MDLNMETLKSLLKMFRFLVVRKGFLWFKTSKGNSQRNHQTYGGILEG